MTTHAGVLILRPNTDGTSWALRDSRDQVHVLRHGDKIRVLHPSTRALIYAGHVALKPTDSTPEDIPFRLWERWFVNGYPAELTTKEPTPLNEAERQAAKAKRQKHLQQWLKDNPPPPLTEERKALLRRLLQP